MGDRLLTRRIGIGDRDRGMEGLPDLHIALLNIVLRLKQQQYRGCTIYTLEGARTSYDAILRW